MGLFQADNIYRKAQRHEGASTMLQRKNWQIYPVAPDDFLRAVPEHPLLAQVLFNRGLQTPAEVRAFLAGSDAVVNNPYRLAGMTIAVQRLVRAIRHRETICVYGDFDVDGVTSTVLLVTALQAAGGHVGPYIPDRVDEGYGLNMNAIDRIATQARLLVTVDCGIRSLTEVAHANALGLEVIVTDHHTVGPELPPALAVINPRRADCPSRATQLAGVGVAYRLAQAVLRAVANDEDSRLTLEGAQVVEASLLDLVALGTVADVMPLLGENRGLVRQGLALINREPRVGVEALMLHAGLTKGAVDATAISFRLAPRLNAAGRLHHARLAYDLLRATDATRAYTLAGELEELNTRRRTLTEAAQADAEEQLAETLATDPPILMARSPHFEHGIVGLVAGKLAERFYRPAVVMRQEGMETRGSARSIPEFDISQALDAVSGLLVRHGGHQLAAGFTVRTADLDEFCQALQTVAAGQLPDRHNLQPKLPIDATVQLAELNRSLAQQFARLEPTGAGNPSPLLLVRACRAHDLRAVGEGRHLKLAVDAERGGPLFDAIAFHQASLERGARRRQPHRFGLPVGGQRVAGRAEAAAQCSGSAAQRRVRKRRLNPRKPPPDLI